MMMLVRLLTFISSALLISGTCLAADPAGARLEAVSGKVLVNQGKGFSAATDSMGLRFGSRIMVGQNAGARLVFPATKTAAACSLELQSTSMVTVTGPDMCDESSSAKAMLFEQPTITPTAMDGGSGGVPPAAVGLGFFVAAGAAAAIFVATDNNGNDTPVSTP
jgi:hypothetical protein